VNYTDKNENSVVNRRRKMCCSVQTVLR